MNPSTTEVKHHCLLLHWAIKNAWFIQLHMFRLSARVSNSQTLIPAPEDLETTDFCEGLDWSPKPDSPRRKSSHSLSVLLFACLKRNL